MRVTARYLLKLAKEKRDAKERIFLPERIRELRDAMREHERCTGAPVTTDRQEVDP